MKEFPTIHRRVLYYVIEFLRNSILPAESKTKMGIANLGTLFGAILINNPDLKPVEALSKMQNQALFIKNLLGNSLRPSLLTPHPAAFLIRFY